MYFQVFIYTFGFYGIWGQVTIKSFLSSIVSPQILTRLSDLAMFLGLPFLVFAWLMLIRFTGSLSGKAGKNSWFIFWFLLINFSVLIILGYFITGTSSLQHYTCYQGILYSNESDSFLPGSLSDPFSMEEARRFCMIMTEK